MSLRTLTLAVMLAVSLPTAAIAGSASDTWQRSYELEALGSYDDALTAIYSVPSSRRGYTWELRRGWLLYLGGEQAEAVKAYQAAVHLEPLAIEPRLGLILPLLAERRWVDAVTAARAVLAIDADNTLALGRLAWAQYNLGRYVEAQEAYSQALAAYPSDVDLRAGLGWTQLQLGRSAEARANFDAVLEVAPRHASALEGREALAEVARR